MTEDAAKPFPDAKDVFLGDVALGDWVQDRTSGYAGVATSFVDYLSGTSQVSIQPRVREDTTLGTILPDAMSFDVQNVQRVKPPEGWEPPVCNDAPETDIVLGVEVRDIITKQTGIATLRYVFLNGCVYYMVTPRNSTDKPKLIEWKQLEVSGDGVLKKITKKMKKVYGDNPPKDPPGGPSLMEPRFAEAFHR